MSATTLHRLGPHALVKAAGRTTLQEFLALYGDAQLLLIRIDDLGGELAMGLDMAERSAAGSIRPKLNVLGFHTVASEAGLDGRMDPPESTFVVRDLTRLLSAYTYFAVPLRKRVSDAAYMDRIAVGRARNKDVVLRHRSVSKFHAWFEVDSSGRYCVADAGSKNGTRHNREVLVSRELRVVNPGDVVSIGSVETVLCPPEVLWAFVHQAE